MIHRVVCAECKSLLEYDDKSVWLGNRDFEDIECPVCRNVIDTVFTDQSPVVRLIKRGEE